MEKIVHGGIERLFGNSLCSSIERIDEHISRHNLNISRDEYLRIGEEISKGRQGVFKGTIEIEPNTFIFYRVVVDGKTEMDGKEFGLLRSVFMESGSFSMTCKEHGTIPYAHGYCPFC